MEQVIQLENQTSEIYNDPIERKRLLEESVRILKNLTPTEIPYDNEKKCLTKPPEWSETRWEAFCLG
jgi:hypothetical protein